MSPRRPATVPDAAPDTTNAVIYVRQSIYRDDSLSLESQEIICQEHCRRHGYHVVAVESDPGRSGTTTANRPGFRRVTEHLDQDRAQVVVAWKWSRYFRHRLHWNVAVHEIESRGGLLESATEPVDVTTASGRLQRGMLAEFAAFEAERTGEVWKETHTRRRARGQPAQGGDRYGYRREGAKHDQRFVPDPEQSEHLAWMYEAFIGGMGFAAIAADLNSRGVRNRLGKPWQRTTVRQLLDSGFAAGLILHQPRDQNGRPAGEPDRTPGAHEPVIDDATWRAYLATRAGRWRTPPRVVEPRYPLTGLVRCGDCGDAMHPTGGGTGQAGHSYVCGRYRTTGEGKCVTAVRANVEAEVLAWLAGLASDLDAAAAADRSTTQVRRRARADVRTAARQVAELDRQLGELTRQLVAGVVPETAYRTARDELTAEREQAAEQLAHAETEQAQRPAKAGRTARSLLDDWDLLAVRDRRDLLATLIARVEVHPPELVDGRRWGRSTVRVVARWAP